MFNPKILKDDFPIFFHHPGLVYLDSTATALKPASVITKLEEYYKKYSANVHRGIYEISEKATEEYEETRKITALFIHAHRPEEIIFTRSTTESLNLVASTLGPEIIKEGDEIVTTIMEHHSNFVPWQHLALETGATFKVIDLDDDFKLPIFKNGKVNLQNIITNKTKILALAHVSNTTGTINPIKEIIQAAKKIQPELIVIVDGAQAAPHMKINVQDLGCDFYAFSGHKMLGPTGVGVLWGKYDLLQKMPPYQFGGSMINEVTLEKATYADVPQKFEAGTPDIASVIAFKSAIQYLEYLGLDFIHEHEKKMTKYVIEQLTKIFDSKIKIYGPKNFQDRAAIITFSFDSLHPHDIAQVLDEENIAIRAGHHCAMPLHTLIGIRATSRASFYIYNDEEDVDKLVKGLQKVKTIFKK